MTDSARVDTLLAGIAERLRIEVIAPLAGGEFGALRVRDGHGRDLVLKAMPSVALAARYARGAEMAKCLRVRGYPAPYYAGTGVESGGSWSLQEYLPGAIPERMTESHARRLLELVQMHAGVAADAPKAGSAHESQPGVQSRLAELKANEVTRPLVTELLAKLGELRHVELLHDGIVHADFHHRNYLAEGDRITGVFDWDFADAGDWRFDLVTLAFWAALLPVAFPSAVSQIIISGMRDLCPPDIIALFAARLTLRQLEFDERVHPERLAGLIAGIEARVAPWWRSLPSS